MPPISQSDTDQSINPTPIGRSSARTNFFMALPYIFFTHETQGNFVNGQQFAVNFLGYAAPGGRNKKSTTRRGTLSTD